MKTHLQALRLLVKIYSLFILLLFPTSTCFATAIKVPQECSSIQTAITASQDGDTILVSPGIYSENIDFILKNITIASLFMITGDRQYIEQTIINGDSTVTNSIVTISGGQSSSTVLCGFTIKSGHGKQVGNAQFGGGVYVSRSSPIIQCNQITSNRISPSCSMRGGGIAIKDTSSPFIFGNTIVYNIPAQICDCVCIFGGGIWIDSTSNPIVGGSSSNANSIYNNLADHGLQIYREGNGVPINAQYNYWGGVPDAFAIFPLSQFDVSHWLSISPTTMQTKSEPLQSQFYLHQNFPNPFNPNTRIRFYLSKDGYSTLSIFNILGKRVATLASGYLSMGQHEIVWDARDFPNGTYFYRLQSGMNSETRRLLLLK